MSDRKQTNRKALAYGEYAIGNEKQRAENLVLLARWRFVNAITRVCPEVFEGLQSDVYPKYLEHSDGRRDYWRYGWSSDPEERLTPHLKEWSRGFNIDEPWVFEGTLQTMYRWSHSADLRDAYIPTGFRPFVSGSILVHEHERKFDFSDGGWDPQGHKTWANFRVRIEEKFRNSLADYEERVRSLAKDRGLVEKSPESSDEHFEWLALFKCGHRTLKQILEAYGSVSVTSAISKGLHKAASLADTEVPTHRKLKSR